MRADPAMTGIRAGDDEQRADLTVAATDRQQAAWEEVHRLLTQASEIMNGVDVRSDELGDALSALLEAGVHLCRARNVPNGSQRLHLQEALHCVRAAGVVTRFAVAGRPAARRREGEAADEGGRLQRAMSRQTSTS